MIRRWSYINISNKVITTPSKTLLLVSSGLNINVTRYFFWKTSKYTVLTRVKWGRRRHLTQLIFFTNILFNWTSEYSFYRRYGSYLRSLHLFRYNYNSFNFMLTKYVPISTLKSSEHTVVSSTYPHLSSFYQQLKPNLLTGIRINRGLVTNFLSFPTLQTHASNSLTTPELESTWLHSGGQSLALTSKTSTYTWLTYLHAHYFNKHYTPFLVGYYRLLVLLYIKNLLDYAFKED